MPLAARSLVAVSLALLLAPLAPSAGDPLGEVTLFGEEEFSIVSATKTELPLSKAPGAVTVIGAKQLRESGARTIPEALRAIAGLNVRWNPMVQTLDIRSFGQNPFSSRVLLLIDGVPYNSWNKGGFPQHPGLDFFVLQNVKRIEIVRGPGSALYGENAYWGVVNIVSLSGEDLEGARVEAYGGDLDTRSLGAMYGKTVGEGSFLASIKALESQIPTAFWAEENDAGAKTTDIFLKGRYKSLEASIFHHEDSFDGFSESIAIPGLPPGVFRSIDKIEQEVDIYALKLEHAWDNGLSFGGDLSYAKRDGSHCAACHASSQSPEFTHTDTDHGNQAIADFRLGFDMIPSHDILVGVEVRRIDAGDHAEELLHETPGGPEVVLSYTKVAAYVQDQISLADDRARLTLGARYDGSTDLFDDEISPRIAGVFELTDAFVLRAGWGKAFRFPTFSELYQGSWFFTYETPFFSIPLATFQPNPGLQPEKTTNIELGGELRISPAVSAKLDLFRSDIEDFIVMSVPLGPPGTVIPIIFENHTDDATITGGELGLRWSLDGFDGYASWSHQEVDADGNGVDSSGKPLELVYAPEDKLAVGMFFGPFAGFRAAIEAQWKDDALSPSFWNLVRETGSPFVPGEIDSFTLVNANVSYELPVGSGSTRFTVHGRDLLDEAPEETVTGVDGHLVGRRFYGSLSFSF